MAWQSALKPLSNLVRGRPVMAVFEICLRCNSRCGYCDLPLNQGRYEMSREEIGRIFRHLHAEGLRYVFVQGGEPLVRRDTLDVLDDLADLGLGLGLVTNGTKLTPGVVARLASVGASVSVSLDTLDRERYREIRGADQLPRVLSGIAALEGYPHPKFITCIVSDRNREDVTAVCRFARARGFAPILGAYHWEVGRYGKSDPSLQFAREQAARTFEAILETDLVPRGYYRRFAEDNATWLRGGRLGRCDAGRYSIVIDASGNVAPCLAQDQAGNLRRQSLDEVLGAMDRSAIEACSKASTCNLLCGRLVGRNLRAPLSALATPLKVSADAG
ncbi:MAG: radical SAM protein [Alphaproteobacteria bacterium]|nr:radical SAM protein [Alphaproteobacteria bacterium]